MSVMQQLQQYALSVLKWRAKYSQPRVVLSSEYVLKVANKLIERDMTFQHTCRSSTQCMPMFILAGYSASQVVLTRDGGLLKNGLLLHKLSHLIQNFLRTLIYQAS